MFESWLRDDEGFCLRCLFFSRTGFVFGWVITGGAGWMAGIMLQLGDELLHLLIRERRVNLIFELEESRRLGREILFKACLV